MQGDSQRGAMPVPHQGQFLQSVSEVKRPKMAPEALIRACRNRLDAIILCIQLSRRPQKQVAKALGIDPGHLTRILAGLAYFPDQKSIDLMSYCGNYAPMQYEAMATGFELFQDAKAKREADLEAELFTIRQQRLGG